MKRFLLLALMGGALTRAGAGANLDPIKAVGMVAAPPPLERVAWITAVGLPRAVPIDYVGVLQADPFAVGVATWSGSPLTALRQAAIKAERAGDTSGARALERKYLDGYGAALERRRILGQKADAGRFDK